MAESPTKLYEGMFLLNQQAVANDFGGAIDFLKQVFERAEAEVVAMRKWDERRLAYTIRGQKRGTYILIYFRARGTQIPNIERDCNLSEQVLRNMIVRAEHVGETELELAKKDSETTLEATPRQDDRPLASPTAVETPAPAAEPVAAAAPDANTATATEPAAAPEKSD